VERPRAELAGMAGHGPSTDLKTLPLRLALQARYSRLFTFEWTIEDRVRPRCGYTGCRGQTKAMRGMPTVTTMSESGNPSRA